MMPAVVAPVAVVIRGVRVVVGGGVVVVVVVGNAVVAVDDLLVVAVVVMIPHDVAYVVLAHELLVAVVYIAVVY